MLDCNCHNTLSTTAFLAQEPWQLSRLQHSGPTGNAKRDLLSIARYHQRRLTSLQDIANCLKGPIARVIRQEHHTARREPIRLQRYQKTGCATSMIDRVLTVPIDCTEIAEYLLSQKSTH